MQVKWKMAGSQWSRPFWGGKSILIFCMAAVFFALIPVKTVCAEPVKIVIDPGHGGTNMGAQYNGFIEKNMTMVVATAMAEELRKYEGIEVYLTRTGDVDLSLQQRADYAKEVGADFVFCLHFNMSENHTLYGMEVWTSAFGKYYAAGKSFGDLWLNEMRPSELYSRGVKTRLDDGADFYGIIKHSVEYQIPAVIIEHCHLDRKEDKGHYETEAALKKLGVTDATAVAKYFALYSPTLEADYRKYEKPKVEIPDKVMKPDNTEPIDVSLTCLRVKPESGEVNILLTGKDLESGLLYYDYSLDGGKTYSSLQKWEEKSGELECMLKVPTDKDLSLKCRVYNGYDLDTETEMIEIPALLGKKEEASETITQTVSGDVSAQAEETEQESKEEEIAETAGSVLEIDMSRYERQDAEKEKNKAALKSDGISQLLWLSVLGSLISMLLFLTIARTVYLKKQKKARRRGRRQ